MRERLMKRIKYCSFEFELTVSSERLSFLPAIVQLN